MNIRPDTRKLLITGSFIFAFGLLCAAITDFILGGIGPHGPRSNLGWLFVMFAMGCLPTGFLTLLLAAAKLLGDRNRPN